MVVLDHLLSQSLVLFLQPPVLRVKPWKIFESLPSLSLQISQLIIIKIIHLVGLDRNRPVPLQASENLLLPGIDDLRGRCIGVLRVLGSSPVLLRLPSR